MENLLGSGDGMVMLTRSRSSDASSSFWVGPMLSFLKYFRQKMAENPRFLL
jgi:hypothetical protein